MSQTPLNSPQMSQISQKDKGGRKRESKRERKKWKINSALNPFQKCPELDSLGSFEGDMGGSEPFWGSQKGIKSPKPKIPTPSTSINFTVEDIFKKLEIFEYDTPLGDSNGDISSSLQSQSQSDSPTSVLSRSRKSVLDCLSSELLHLGHSYPHTHTPKLCHHNRSQTPFGTFSESQNSYNYNYNPLSYGYHSPHPLSPNVPNNVPNVPNNGSNYDPNLEDWDSLRLPNDTHLTLSIGGWGGMDEGLFNGSNSSMDSLAKESYLSGLIEEWEFPKMSQMSQMSPLNGGFNHFNPPFYAQMSQFDPNPPFLSPQSAPQYPQNVPIRGYLGPEWDFDEEDQPIATPLSAPQNVSNLGHFGSEMGYNGHFYPHQPHQYPQIPPSTNFLDPKMSQKWPNSNNSDFNSLYYSNYYSNYSHRHSRSRRNLPNSMSQMSQKYWPMDSYWESGKRVRSEYYPHHPLSTPPHPPKMSQMSQNSHFNSPFHSPYQSFPFTPDLPTGASVGHRHPHFDPNWAQTGHPGTHFNSNWGSLEGYPPLNAPQMSQKCHFKSHFDLLSSPSAPKMSQKYYDTGHYFDPDYTSQQAEIDELKSGFGFWNASRQHSGINDDIFSSSGAFESEGTAMSLGSVYFDYEDDARFGTHTCV